MVITRDGKEIELTPLELLEAYKEENMSFLYVCAARQLRAYVEKTHNQHNIFESDDILPQGVTVDDLCDRESEYCMLDFIVDEYLRNRNDDTAENVTWLNAVKSCF